MLLAIVAIVTALVATAGAFFLGYAAASVIARRRLSAYARRAAALNDELKRRLIKLGVGLGIGA